MTDPRNSRFTTWRWAAVAFALCLGADAGAQMIDLGTNSVSDIWELKFNAASLAKGVDTDGDGANNRHESIAGTDPFDPDSSARVAVGGGSGQMFGVNLYGFAGKYYELQSLASLAGTNWQSETSVIARVSSTMTLSGAAGPAEKFFRVLISDVDSDGDGVNDWEEYQIGTDPLTAASSGRLDENGQPLGDFPYAVAGLASQNVVTIRASDPEATQPGAGEPATSLGGFTVVRGGFPLNAITVNLALTAPGPGVAVENLDHAALPRPILLPVGAAAGNVEVVPMANTNRLSPVVATLKVTGGPGYTIGAFSNASVVIYPSPNPAGTGLTAQYWDNANSTYANAANFSGTSVTRIDPTINFNWGGTPNAAVNRDNFSATWEGRLVTGAAGNYQFDLQADDGARLYVDNQLIIDAWAAGSATAAPIQSAPVALQAGTNYPIRVEYYELTNSVMIHLRWKPPTSSSFASIPTGNILRPSSSFSNYLASYFNNTNLTGSPVYTNYESAAYYDWLVGSPDDPLITPTLYSARWTGQIQPQYSEPYTFIVRTDDGSKLWVNGQLIVDDWRNKGASDVTSTTIDLQAGVRYDVKMEYFQNTGGSEARLYWYSPSQPKQIIPAARLYPTSVTPAPTSVTSPLTAYAFLGQYFTHTVTAANGPLGYAVTGLPPGLSFSTTNGLISGTPLLAGLYSITITATNAVGTGASVLELEVFDTGSAVTRDVWLGVAGTNISDIPLTTAPTSSAAWGALAGVTDFGDNYAERIRGYLTAPVTGNYYFWIAGGDAAELWISNDHEPVNKVRRSRVAPGGTGPQQWNVQPGQRSPWLALVAGQRYYLEILHKAGVGAGDNWSVGWRVDPTGTNTLPSSLVPNYLLSRHFEVPPAFIPGTLYTANLLAQPGAISSGAGTATLRVSADETHAVLKYSYGGLSGPITSEHIHSEPYLGFPSTILFDIDEAVPDADGSLHWEIEPAGALSVADIREIIRSGKAYINLHTAAYPSGEIKGNFTLAEGSQTFSPPPAPPEWTDDYANANAAARFLIQASFGPTSGEIAAVQALGYEGWIDDQFALPVSAHLPVVHANVAADPTLRYPGTLTFNTWWRQSVTAPDQLRQRVAFALSEILVVSEEGILENRGTALSSYYDTLLQHSFGNFRDLLEAVTLTPAMGLYLDMRRNEKGSIITGTHPNENYAREVLQLFSVGLYRTWPDGTLIMNSEGNLVPTYGQEEILGFSRVFTGWNYSQSNQGNGRLPTEWNPPSNYTNSMVLVPARHELGTKRVLDNVMLPQAWGNEANSASAEYDIYGPRDLELAHDSIFLNENVGPYICRQLIQRLVTSHPTRDYLYRVVAKFNDNGSGVRGDMKAVIKAILLDYQARSSAAMAQPTFGKQREPLLRVTAPARALSAPPPLPGTYAQNGNQVITVTTAAPHLLSNNDDPFLAFTDTGGNPAPPDRRYADISGATLTSFTVSAPGLSTGTYGQSGTVITVTNSGHGLAAGNSVHLTFTTGGATGGVFLVNSVPTANVFTVTAVNSATRTGSCLFPKWTGGGYVQTGANVLFSLTLPHGLSPGDQVSVNFTQAGSPADGLYTVTATNSDTQFSISVGSSVGRTQNGQVIYPLIPPPLVRSGTVELRYNSWEMNATDTGSSSSLSQTPLNAPTVFNYFFPDFKFPGILASAGLTTPEFQLTSDTEAVLQLNFLANGTITGGNNSANSSRTNGLSSFSGGSGAIVLDYRNWMSPAYTTNSAGITALVSELSTLLTGGQLSSAAQTGIVDYVGTVTSSNATAQRRDRVAAAIHLILCSPEFTIQK